MTSERYSKALSFLHWLTAFMFLASYLISDGMPRFFDQHLDGIDLSGQWVVNFHVYAGIAFLAVVLTRLIVKLLTHKPTPLKSGNATLNKLAVGTHHLLYLLMIVVPVAGVIAWYEKVAIFADIHVVLMNGMLALIGLHVAAALYHQLVLKDGVICRISPFKCSK